MSDDWSSWVPILWTADARKSLQFYCDVLGFSKDWEHQNGEGFPLYIQVSRGSVGLHLSEHGDGDYHSHLAISVPDVDAVYAEFTRRGLETNGPPEDRDYGVRDFTFSDPDGHRFVFTSRLETFETSPGRNW